MDGIISKGWERVLNRQEGNTGNVSYLLELRKSCLASQIRQGVWFGISRSATCPAQLLLLGVFKPLLDTQEFSPGCNSARTEKSRPVWPNGAKIFSPG